MTGSIDTSASLAPPASVPCQCRVCRGLRVASAELERLGVRAGPAWRYGDDGDRRPGLWVDGRGVRAGLSQAFHVNERTLLLEDRAVAWAQVVATLALEVKA